jgi:hypothetical protein
MFRSPYTRRFCPVVPGPTTPLYCGEPRRDEASDKIPFWRRRDPTCTSELHWRWLLACMKGQRPGDVARRFGVEAREVSDAVSLLGISVGVPRHQPTAITVAARHAYSTQRAGAEKRGIGWEFTLETWWEVWAKSGKWAQRGTSSDSYVMARAGDVGPYSPGNVRIATQFENMAEYHAGRRARCAA